MKLRNTKSWQGYFCQFGVHTLRQMAERYDIDFRPGTRHQMLASRLAQLHVDGARVRGAAAALAPDERLALRLGVDGGDAGIPGATLESELRRLGIRGRPSLVQGLLERGLLLLDLQGRALWQDGDAGFAPGGFREWTLVVHPAIRELVADLAVPGEARRWEALTVALGSPKLLRQTPSSLVADALGRMAEVIERFPLPFTRQGHVRAALRRHLANLGFPSPGSLPFELWLRAATACGLVVAHGNGERWTRTPLAARAATEPLEVYSALPRAAAELAWPLRQLTGGGWEAWNQIERTKRGGSLRGHGPDVLDLCLLEWRAASATFLRPGVWFADDELEPLLRGRARGWVQERGSSPWLDRTHELPSLIDRAALLVAHLFDVLCHLGLVDRGLDGERRVSRVTPFGAAVLRAVAITDPSAGSTTGVPGLVDELGWEDDGTIRIADETDRAFVELALGSLARPEAGGGLRVDEKSLVHALHSGASAGAIAARLDQVVPGVRAPDCVHRALAAAVEQHRPVTLCEDVVGLEVAGLSDDEREALAGEGYPVVGNVVLVPWEDLEDVGELLDARVDQSFDYLEDPIRAVELRPDGSLEIPEHVRDDLGLREALAGLGVTQLAAPAPRLSFFDMPGVDALDERRQRALIDAALQRLIPHLAPSTTAGARVGLLAEAGLVDAPTVTDRVVLTFPDVVALGLIRRNALGPAAEAISGGRFLVPEEALSDVEERLSALGIPFPAHRSSLRARVAAQDAVSQLQAAVAELGAAASRSHEKDEPPAAEGQGERPAPRKARRTRDSAREERLREIVREAVGEGRPGAAEGARGAGADDAAGLRIGEIAERTGHEAGELRPVLRRLVQDGELVLGGRGRGARYQLADRRVAEDREDEA